MAGCVNSVIYYSEGVHQEKRGTCARCLTLDKI